MVQNSSKFPANLPDPEYKIKLKWTNIIFFSILHILCIASFFVEKKWQTIVFAILQAALSGIGLTVGTHRLFSHNSFKVNTTLKVLLIYLQSLSFQNSVYDWVRIHRLHHKYTDTNADPHNSRRGFFFCHMGWLLCKRHPDVKKFGSTLSMADLEADEFVMFQHRHFAIIKLVVAVLIPALIPCYFWNESFLASFLFVDAARYVLNLHLAWLTNSAAHNFGTKPYDKSISSKESFIVSVLTTGEGWHNFHHVFPYDYKTSHYGSYFSNFTTAYIDFFAWIGWAYDLKVVSSEMMEKRASRTGDGSYKSSKNSEFSMFYNELVEEFDQKNCIDDNEIKNQNNEGHVYGYNDALLDENERMLIKTLKKHD